MICRNHVDVSEGVRRCSRCGSTFCRDCLVEIGGAPYCAMCKTEQLLDVRSGVSGVLDFASIGRRFGASFLDGLITGIPAMIMVFIAIGLSVKTGGSRFASPLFWIPSILAVVYQASMLKARGQTLGKMAMRVKVVRPDGSDISGGQAWGREVSRALLGFLYIVDYIPAFFTNDRRTLHDMLANTRVVNWSA
jgi:uncharacterized RDD family membrane protein YckC